MRFATAQGFNSGDQFYSYLKDSFDALYAEGVAGRAKMMSVGLHYRLIGRPGRVQALRRFIEYIQGFDVVWTPRRIDIAKHWQQNHPAQEPWERPSEMDEKTFISNYGCIFEHSPWVAQAAHNLELGAGHDTATGLHNALCRAFRSAGRDARLSVLTAHPDLAGKLAAAKRLTDESSNEQASAGLDMLTDCEHETFTKHNAAYTAKHGFPFIIAVRYHGKSAILTAFEARIANDSETEFNEACRQVERIAHYRLKDLLP